MGSDYFAAPVKLTLTLAESSGAAFLRATAARYDVLLVDAYDAQGLPEPLGTQRFFDDSCTALTPDGILVVNLHADHPHHAIHVDRIARSFDGASLVVDDTTRDNRIVFAEKGRPPPGLRIGPLRRPAPLDESAWQPLQASMARILAALKVVER